MVPTQSKNGKGLGKPGLVQQPQEMKARSRDHTLAMCPQAFLGSEFPRFGGALGLPTESLFGV